MASTLHQQLKDLYAADPDQQEVTVDGFRIDVVRGKELVEVQLASLAAIRDKIRVLLEDHSVLVVKPLAASKILIKRSRKGGRVTSTRRSPKKETIFDLFEELVHFIGVFPHPRLSLHVLMTEQKEYRLPQTKRRWRSKDYRVEDRRLVEVRDRHQFRTADDLLALLPTTLPQPFSTADIAREAEIPRWLAQKMAYCLRKIAAVDVVGKTGNSMLYRFDQTASAA